MRPLICFGPFNVPPSGNHSGWAIHFASARRGASCVLRLLLLPLLRCVFAREFRIVGGQPVQFRRLLVRLAGAVFLRQDRHPLSVNSAVSICTARAALCGRTRRGCRKAGHPLHEKTDRPCGPLLRFMCPFCPHPRELRSLAQHPQELRLVVDDRNAELPRLRQLAAGAFARDDEVGLLRHAAGHLRAERLQLFRRLIPRHR